MVTLEDVCHLPLLPTKVSKNFSNENYWYQPVEIAEIELYLRDDDDDGARFKEGNKILVYVAGRIEREGQHYLIFGSKNYYPLGGIFCQKPKPLEDIANYIRRLDVKVEFAPKV